MKNSKIRVVIKANASPLVQLLDTERERAFFVDALWGVVKYSDEGGNKKESAFVYKYRSQQGLIGEFDLIDFHFNFGTLEGFALKADERVIAPEHILRLSFYARTDHGAILVSFEPWLAEDAQKYVSRFVKKTHSRIIVQHLAAAWLHEIWGMAEA